MADIHERDRDLRRAHQAMQIVGHGADVGGALRRIAEAEAGAVVGADPGECRDLRLDAPPDHHAAAGAGVEHHDRTARPLAMEIDAPGPFDRDCGLRSGVDRARRDRLRDTGPDQAGRGQDGGGAGNHDQL
nr:hypothetical protein [Roseiarcus fermentans]